MSKYGVLFLLISCMAFVGQAVAQPDRPGRVPVAEMSPEQQAEYLARRERLRLLRDEMQRDARLRGEGREHMQRLDPPPALHPMPPGWREHGLRWQGGAEGEARLPSPPRYDIRPIEAREDLRVGEPGPQGANRLSKEERRQLRRQMREAGRQLYGEPPERHHE